MNIFFGIYFGRMEYILKGDDLRISRRRTQKTNSDAGEEKRPFRGRGKVSSRLINRHLSHLNAYTTPSCFYIQYII